MGFYKRGVECGRPSFCPIPTAMNAGVHNPLLLLHIEIELLLKVEFIESDSTERSSRLDLRHTVLPPI